MKTEENEVKRPKALISTISKRGAEVSDPEDGDEIDNKIPTGERGG